MNLLLITFSFPPAGGVGVLRALSLARYLPQHGIRVDVLTARNAPSVGRDSKLLSQVPPEVTVHRTWTLDLPFALRKGIKRLLSRSPAAPSAPAVAPPQTATPPPPDRGNPLKRLIGNLLLPDPQIGWLPFALPAARRLVRSRHIDAVLITVPPFSSAKLVTGLRRAFPSLPIILDFRDEWLSTTIDLVSFNNNARAREVAQRTEREAVHAATRVVLVTEAARSELLHRYPNEPAAKFLCVHNGFDRDLPSLVPAPAPASAGRITLTYIGTVYGSTDPSTLVAAVLSLPATLRSRLRLRFIGHIETENLRQTLLSLNQSTPGLLEIHGFLPQSEALKAIESTDWLLLVTRDRINVAAKFYDYLGGGKPIFAAIHPEGAVRSLLESTQSGVWADVFSAPAIAGLLTRVLDPDAPDALSPGSIHPSLKAIAGFHRSSLASLYADELRAALAETSATTAK